MTSAALMLVVLWERSPALSVALVGPLIAIALYQRSNFKALRAMRLALTDPLTGLGNHRHFHERLQRELTQAEQRRPALASASSTSTTSSASTTGSATRSATASSGRSPRACVRAARASGSAATSSPCCCRASTSGRRSPSRARSSSGSAAVEVEQVGAVTVSAGIAAYPAQGVGRDELIRLADSALYWAKEDGKNRARTYQARARSSSAQLAAARREAPTAQRATARRRASRRRSTRATSTRAATRSASASSRRGSRGGSAIDEPQIELTRLAGSLHDLGKLAIPEEILRKPGALNESERLVLQRHPQIGYRMLESLGVEPIADWVLHHHERWDGSGYPDRLRGEQIPLGARIIFVADAFDAMTSERVYRKPLSDRDAVAELERCAGTQFDPAVVEAFSRRARPRRRARAAQLVSVSGQPPRRRRVFHRR